MNEKVHALINQQINKEFYSAYLYLNFSNYFEEVGLDGFANWYKIQAHSECPPFASLGAVGRPHLHYSKRSFYFFLFA